MNAQTPRESVEKLQANRRVLDGDDERFTGYGIMGMPFASGHYLTYRDMVTSSVGPPYRAIWHRDPNGSWTISTSQAPEVSCPRYFGSAARVERVPAIDVSWVTDHDFQVNLGDELSWQIALAATPATRAMTAMGSTMPTAAWTSPSVLRSMGPMARAVLRSGRVRLYGVTPNGPRFKAAPLQIWRVVGTRAMWRGLELGAHAPLSNQTRLADFWLPQRGLFFIGDARFSAAHTTTTSSHESRIAS
ncbi:hypothetical protein [Paramicrobacterium fandaimingii]|uniref:hypothetical protein n=1 Tax=Paramicrobacterium fandaimingii TaxID=2708079 RepID=UPI0014220B4D|nr:hypothetical protein [Microbacterium fandaimingii]